MKIGICLASLLLLSCSSLAAQDFTGTWVGDRFTYNPNRIVRTPRQTIEISGSGKELAGELVGRRSRTPLKAVLEEGTGRITLVGYMEFEGGEHLRWYLELKDDELRGVVSALHDGPAKWDEDWSGPVDFKRQPATP
jgi:hypothetical protein